MKISKDKSLVFVLLMAISNVFVTGTNDRANAIISKNGKSDSNIYKTVNETGSWYTFKNGKLVIERKRQKDVKTFIGFEDQICN